MLDMPIVRYEANPGPLNILPAKNLLDLPNKILVKILHYLSPTDLNKTRITCRKIYQLLNDEELFHQHLLSIYQNFLDNLNDFHPKIQQLAQDLPNYRRYIDERKDYYALNLCGFILFFGSLNLITFLFLYAFTDIIGIPVVLLQVSMPLICFFLITSAIAAKYYLNKNSYRYLANSQDAYDQWLYKLKLQHQDLLKNYDQLFTKSYWEKQLQSIQLDNITESPLNGDHLRNIEHFIILARAQSEQLIAALKNHPDQVSETAKRCRKVRNNPTYSRLQFFSNPNRYSTLSEENSHLSINNDDETIIEENSLSPTCNDDEITIVVEDEGQKLEKKSELEQEKELVTSIVQSYFQRRPS